MRKKIAALLAASIVLGALAGCSGSQGGAQAKANQLKIQTAKRRLC